MNKQEKSLLLRLSREAIASVLDNNKIIFAKNKISENLKQKLATFITLTINHDLRGCIGHLEPIQELYQDVIENAQAAAFSDPRFLPLIKEELPKIKIEISILSPSQKFTYSSGKELVQYLEKNKPGVILSKGRYSATFLPQVWEELPDAVHFLDHLCLKAGLKPEAWQEGVTIETYTVEKFQEI